jgi:hypothetical protein
MPNMEAIKTANNVRVPRMYKYDRSAEGHIKQQAGWHGNRAGCIQAFSGRSRTHQLVLAELAHMGGLQSSKLHGSMLLCKQHPEL